MRTKKFWSLLGLFQLAFGLAVFFGTRHYYGVGVTPPSSNRTELASSAPVLSEQLAAISPAVLNSLVPLQNDPATPAEIAHRANEYFAANDYANAAVLYEQLVNMDARNVDGYNNLGITLHYLGRSSEAIQWLEAGSEIDEANQRIWLTLGFVRKETGQVESARVALRRAVEMGANTTVGESAARFLSELPQESR